MQTTVVLEEHTYCYEDHLADMGNSPSTEAPAPESGAAPPVAGDAEQNAIARLQAITGAKAAETTRVKPRGPKADTPDYPAIQVRATALGADQWHSTPPTVPGRHNDAATYSGDTYRAQLCAEKAREKAALRLVVLPATSFVLSCIASQRALCKLLLFDRLDPSVQSRIVEHTWVRCVPAGEILIQEGEYGLAASELYVVKTGSFEVRGRHSMAMHTTPWRATSF